MSDAFQREDSFDMTKQYKKRNATDHLTLMLTTIIYIHQCLGLVLWSTEVLTESLPLLFGIPFSIVHILSIVIFILWTFSANKHMDGWMDGWISLQTQYNHESQKTTAYG